MMRRRQEAQGALFYDFDIEALVPQDHLLRSIDRFVDLSGVRAHLAPFNSSTGRPSIDPELMVRMLIVGYADNGTVFSYDVGLTVPMTVVKLDGDGLRLTIRSVSVELPRLGQRSFTELVSSVPEDEQGILIDHLARILENVLSSTELAIETALSAQIDPETLSTDELRFGILDPEAWRESEVTLMTVGRGRGAIRSEQRKESYQVVTDLAFDPSTLPPFKVVSTETCWLTTHAAPGDAEVFRKPPSDWFDHAAPDVVYRSTPRRHAGEDQILEQYRVLESIEPTADVELNWPPWFKVRPCPTIVKADKDVPGDIKKVHLPGDTWPAPRRDDFSAISAFRNSRVFFDMLESFGLDPVIFVVRAQDC